MIIFVSLVLLIVGIIIYTGFIAYLIRYWEHAFKIKFPRCKYLIRPILIFISLFPIASTINFIWHPDYLGMETLVIIGFVVGAFFLYIAIFMVVTHIFVFITMNVFKKGRWTRNTRGRMVLISSEIIFALFFCFFGLWGALNTEVNNIDIGTGDTAMKVVALSDIHYATPGSMVDLEKMVALINAQNPDLVIMAGDVFDNKVAKINEHEFAQTMAKIKSTYGVYAINGNHEYYENNHAEIRQCYQNSKITLLVDSTATINNMLRIVGREDYSQNHKNFQRKSVDELLKNTNTSLPILVLDHQPQFYREAKEAGAFLEVAGHTHNGQIWPGDILVHLIYKFINNSPSDGINTYDDFTLAITRGYGTWGFPMRSTGTSEMLTFNFKESVFEKN